MTGDRFTLDPGLRVFVNDLRLSWARVTRRAGLPGDLLASGPAQLTTDEYYRFWDALADEGGDHDLAVEVGRAISAEMFSPPIVAAMCSSSLRVAVDRIAAYKPLIGPLGLAVQNTADSMQIVCQWPSEPPALLATSELVFWVALARLGSRQHIRPTHMTLPTPPRDLATLEAYLGAPVRIGLTHAVAFTALDADRLFLTENDAMWDMLSPELGRRLTDLKSDATAADRVRAALQETLPAGESSIDAVTRKLTISPRTLQRQLRNEGTSYQTVLTSTRESLARRYLQHSNLRTTEIAYLLGYNDTSSFYRAFRTWTGATPDAHRNATPTQLLG